MRTASSRPFTGLNPEICYLFVAHTTHTHISLTRVTKEYLMTSLFIKSNLRLSSSHWRTAWVNASQICFILFLFRFSSAEQNNSVYPTDILLYNYKRNMRKFSFVCFYLVSIHRFTHTLAYWNTTAAFVCKKSQIESNRKIASPIHICSLSLTNESSIILQSNAESMRTVCLAQANQFEGKHSLWLLSFRRTSQFWKRIEPSRWLK